MTTIPDRNSPVERCAAQHFGPWMVHAPWMSQAVAAVKAGTFKPEFEAKSANASDPAIVGEWLGDEYKVRYYIEDGVARVPFFGQVAKGSSSFGGASSVWTRQSVRKAANDDRVSAILLHIDSPGGTVAGTGDLAGDIAAINRLKPVYTYFEDLGASAAYWIGSQARRIFANPTAEIGSIGTMTYVEDTSGMYEKAGIKVTLIATGPIKGQWVDGNPVSEEYIAAVRTEIEDLNEHFLQGVMQGRGMTREQLNAVADGRVFIAAKAQQLGLIDQVASLDVAMQAITKEISIMPITATQFSAHAAENPKAPEVQALIQQGIEQAKAEANRPATLEELEAIAPGDSAFAVTQLKAKATVAQAATAAVKAMADKLAAAETAAAAAVAKAKEVVANGGSAPIPDDKSRTADGAVSPERKRELMAMTSVGRTVLERTTSASGNRN